MEPNLPEQIPIPKTNHTIFIILCLTFVFLLGSFSLFYFQSKIEVVNEYTDWKTYRNDKYGFEIKHPAGWFVSELGDGVWRLQSADPINNSHGIGLPAVGNMWVYISSSVCHNPNNDNLTDFIAESEPDILEASECQDNFYITVGLWQTDPNLNKNKQILNQILSTFKFINSTTTLNSFGMDIRNIVEVAV